MEHFISNKYQDFFSFNEVMATSSSVAGTLTETAAPREENSTLKLKLKKKKQTKKIQWTEDTVDNEGIDYCIELTRSYPKCPPKDSFCFKIQKSP